MSSTKKVKSAGRFGSRYGVGIRKRLLKVESDQKKAHGCPFCGLPRVKRQAPGIFHCNKCQATFSGGAYVPQTLTGSIVQKMIVQKSFLPSLSELVHATEISKHEIDTEAEGSEEAEPVHKKHKKETEE